MDAMLNHQPSLPPHRAPAHRSNNDTRITKADIIIVIEVIIVIMMIVIIVIKVIIITITIIMIIMMIMISGSLRRGRRRPRACTLGARQEPFFGGGDDTVGNPHRAQISRFELFEPILSLD